MHVFARMSFFLAALAASSPAAHAATAAAQALPFGPLPAKVPVPEGNLQSEAKVELGKMLFFDPRLSVNGTISCNSCHNVMAGGDDNLAVSVGVRGQTGKRSAPTVWNSAFMTSMFWDGRAATLEDQAKGPMVNSVEMGMSNHDLVVTRLKASPEYVDRFKKVFGGGGNGDAVTIDNAVKAIAAFERTLVTPDSPVDRFLKGDKKALSAKAQEGLKLVQEIGCTSCHQGVNFAGPALPAGQGFFQKFPVVAGTEYEKSYRLSEDLGRFEETKQEADKGMWRVPTWRNVALTAPYFHNGSVATLPEAVRVMAKTQLDKDLAPEQVEAITEFLTGLTGKFPKIAMPRIPATPGRSLYLEQTGASH